MQPLGTDDPRRIGAYRLLGVLGAGGMGKVYLGRNAGGRTVAVKVIRPDLVGDTEFRTRFRREVAAAQRVGGAFTAPVIDADVDADPPWLATGYVAGLSLSDAVDRFGPFAEPTLRTLAHGLAEALVAVHATGIVHRDLKPSNVMLAIDGPKVIDFGIARAVEDVALTTTGRVVGSPGFMCPEQVNGQPLGPACDVFALGGVLTFAASGHGPFGHAELMQILWRIVYEEPRVDALPPSLRPIVAACLAKDPADRPTPHQLLAQLAALGTPERAGWLPPPVLEEVSVRAIRLLDLDSDPADPDRTVTSRGQRPDTWPPTLRPDAWSSVPHRDPSAPYRGQSTSGPHGSATGWPPPTTGPARVQDAASTDPTVLRDHLAPKPPDRSRRTRTLLTVAIAAVLVAAAAGTFLIGAQLRDRPDATTTSVSTDAPTGNTVPDAFLGEWTGQAADGLVRFDIELTIGAGAVGAELATSANTGVIGGERCERAETLTAVGDRELTFRARLTTSGGTCVDDGADSTVTLEPDGALRYRTPGLFGGVITGVLRRS